MSSPSLAGNLSLSDSSLGPGQGPPPTGLRNTHEGEYLDTLPLGPLLRNPSKAIFSNDREQFCFTFFRERTGYEFSSYYGSSFWSGTPLQSCIFHPAAQQAVIAVGAVHRRMELGISPEAFLYCDFAVKSYASAMHNLNAAINEGDPKAFELAMVVPPLLGAFEAFQGNPEQALNHMVGWLKILFDRPFQRVSTSSVRTTVALTRKTLIDFFSRLEDQAMELFGSEATINQQPDQDEPYSLPQVPASFSTHEEARDTLFALVHCFLNIESDYALDRSVWLKVQQAFGVRLLEWSCAFADYSKTFFSSVQRGNARAARLLRVYRHAGCLLLLMESRKRSSRNQNAFDGHDDQGHSSGTRALGDTQAAYTAHFTRLIWRADSISNSAKQDGQYRGFEQFHFDQPTLYIDNDTSSAGSHSSNLLKQVASLLENSSDSEKVWETMGAYSVAESIGALESKVLSASATSYKRHINATAVDVILYLEQRTLLVRYCVPATDRSLVWTQDRMTF